jgi:HD domain
MSAVGSWAWAQQTDGRLSRGDRAHLIGQGVVARLSRLPAPWRRAVIGTESSVTLPSPPDSALARLAEQRVRELSAPVLHAHCLRTWAFAVLFAQRDEIAHDEELLYLACVLHDLGLTADHDRRDSTAACFAVEGARAAHELLCGHGEAEDRARTVAQAITLHLNINVPERLGAEAHLLSKGVSLDTIGRHIHRLPTSRVHDVNDRWPREGFSDYLIPATRRQAQIRPQSRSALLHRLGFPDLLRANPLDRPLSGRNS